METNITASVVLRGVDGPPRAQRETILFVHAYAETVAALGLPIGTIMSRLAAGRAVLAKLK